MDTAKQLDELMHDSKLEEEGIFVLIMSKEPRKVFVSGDKQCVIYTIFKNTWYHSLELVTDYDGRYLVEELGVLNLETGSLNTLKHYIINTIRLSPDNEVTVVVQSKQPIRTEIDYRLISLDDTIQLLQGDKDKPDMEDYLIEPIEELEEVIKSHKGLFELLNL